MTTNHGLILNPQEKHHWIAGSGKATKKLGADAGEINPSGDWTRWAPSEELQNRYGFETQACVSFAILKAIITLAKFKGYEIPHNLSERYTAYVTGTTLEGNDPWKVAEQTATQFGVVAEEALPWSDSIRDWMGFYAGVDETLVALGQTVLRRYDIEPEWVIPPINNYTIKEKQERIKRALKRGTVVASVRAWDKNGKVYVKDAGAPDNHLVFLPKHGEASDQYEPFKKKLDPIYDHQAAIVFFMRPNPTGVAPFERNYLLTLLQKALSALKRLLARPPVENRVDVPSPAPVPVVEAPKPKPVEPPKPKGIDYGQWPELVKAIIKVESGGVDNAVGDKHLTDKAYGCMQIRRPVCIDVNRVYKTNLSPLAMFDRQLSIDTFYKYMSIYATKKQIGREPTHQDRARIWNGGPTGWKRSTTEGYWAKVQKSL